jgi:hypothetical protein
MKANKSKRFPKRFARSSKTSSTFGPFPESMNIAIRYSTRINYSASAFTVYNVGMSSLQTFQGFYRDQLMALYTSYCVLGFTAKYKITNNDVSGVQAEVLDFNAPSSVVSGITFANAIEWPSTRKHMVTSIGNAMTITFQKHYDLKDIYRKDISADSDFWGSASAAPPYGNLEEHCLGIYSFDGTSTVKLLIDREYIFHVRFFRRANPGNSLASVLGTVAVFPEKPKPKTVKKKEIVVSDSD